MISCIDPGGPKDRRTRIGWAISLLIGLLALAAAGGALWTGLCRSRTAGDNDAL